MRQDWKAAFAKKGEPRRSKVTVAFGTRSFIDSIQLAINADQTRDLHTLTCLLRRQSAR
jgi:hypothetical protein